MTLEAWVNPTVVDSSWRDVIYKANDCFYLEATSAWDGVPAGGGSFGSDDVAVGAATALPLNVWTHLAVTYDGATLILYVNGVPVSSLAQAGAIQMSADPLQIGGDDLFGQYFAGAIDEIRIYNAALTPEQIVADMSTPVGGGSGQYPVLTLSATALDFGNQFLHAVSNAQTVTLTNTGNASMALGGITILGAASNAFHESDDCGSTLPVNGTCTITVTFTANQIGPAGATISIADTAPGSPHTIALAGTGVSAGFSISPLVATIPFNGTQQFTVSGATGNMMWLVDGIPGGSVATGTITGSGLYSAPNEVGVHTITVSTPDLSQAADATVYVIGSTGAGISLHLSVNRRYLVDQNNAPFMIVGDSPQSLIGNISESDAALYFADRQAAGINAVWINLLCNNGTACNGDGTTYDGIPPFTTDGDLSTPNEAYFKRADDMINLAAQYGIVVFLDPAETGGWLPVLQANGTTKAFNYGVYVGNRYKNFPNIVWLSGNDFQTWRTPEDDAVVLAVGRGIQSVDPNHLQTAELDYTFSSTLDDSNWAPIVSLNAAYTYYPTYAEVLHAYNQSNQYAVFMIEANYEFEHHVTPAILRRQEYWTMLSGATGQFYGNSYIWTFSDGWWNNLDTPGALQLRYVINLFGSRQWYNLVPDQNHAIVTDGYGTFSDSDALADNDYATVAATADGTLVMAYLPTVRTITVDMTKLSGPVFAQWFDPTNGTYLPISGSPLSNSGVQQFTPPGNNGDGDGDWILVLEQ
jgi:hypothetical protein